jgi:hypothetical protein
MYRRRKNQFRDDNASGFLAPRGNTHLVGSCVQEFISKTGNGPIYSLYFGLGRDRPWDNVLCSHAPIVDSGPSTLSLLSSSGPMPVGSFADSAQENSLYSRL